MNALYVIRYSFRWTVDYTAWERVRSGFRLYDTSGQNLDLPF
jgi:hypothetical protein